VLEAGRDRAKERIGERAEGVVLVGALCLLLLCRRVHTTPQARAKFASAFPRVF
jgi:hypothetical protein